MILTGHYESPLGGITLAGEDDALVGLWLEGQKHFASTLGPDVADGWLSVFGETVRWLDSYFRGTVPAFTPRLDLRGTPFRRAVWEALLGIPYGKTVSYGELAASLGTSARAIGGAVGHNPVSIIVPCHRVIGAEGRLTGYAGGLDLKVRLLELERSGRSLFPFPKLFDLREEFIRAVQDVPADLEARKQADGQTDADAANHRKDDVLV